MVTLKIYFRLVGIAIKEEFNTRKEAINRNAIKWANNRKVVVYLEYNGIIEKL